MITIDGLIEVVSKFDLLQPSVSSQLASLRTQYNDAVSLGTELVRRGWLTSYQLDSLLQGGGETLVLGSYQLLEPVGQGGMGAVFKARHAIMNRIVAIKVIRKELLPLPDALERFRREIQSLASLNHANVVVAYHADRIGDTLYLVMEYLDGINLAKLIEQQGPLPVHVACDYIRQAALGLQHIHEQGLVHRDIKPANLFVCPKTNAEGAAQVVKILDLGLVRLYGQSNSGERLTERQIAIGTPGFMAPEQVLNSREVDIRADIYSLGCTLYHLLSGKRPFPEVGNVAQRLATMTTPVSIRQQRREVTPELEAVIAKMLAIEPEDRYETPAEVAEALAKFAVPDNDTVTPPTVFLPLPFAGDQQTPLTMPTTIADHHATRQRPARKRWLLVSALVLPLLVLAVLYFVWPPQPQRNDDVNPPGKGNGQQAQQKTKPLPGKLLGVFTGHKDWAAAARFVGDTGRIVSGGAEGIFVWHEGSAKPDLHVNDNVSGVHSLAVSGNGRWLVAGTQTKKRNVEMWEMPALQRRPLPIKDGTTITIVDIAPDSKWALSADSAKTLWLWNLETGEAVRSFITSGYIRCIGFSVDSGMALCVSSTADEGERTLLAVQRWRIPDGEQEPPQSLTVVQATCLTLAPGGNTLAAGDHAGTITIWEAKGMTEVGKIAAHTNAVACLAFSHDGKRLLSAGEGKDSTLRLWNVAERQLIHSFDEPSAAARSLTFSPDDKRALSVHTDKSICLWRLPE